MPGVPPNYGKLGPLPSDRNTVNQQINSVAAIAAGVATNTTRFVLDRYQNVVAIYGQLNQSVTEGGSFTGGGATPANTAVSGTISSTGLTGIGQALCKFYPAATAAGSPTSDGSLTTMSVTAASTTVTIASGSNTVNGMGIAGYGIPAGTTIVSGGGTTTLVISKAATLTGTGLPCTIFQWLQS